MSTRRHHYVPELLLKRFASLLKETMEIRRFVNADVIAKGLSAFDPDSAAFEAGRIMLERLRNLASQKVSFAFETTLSSRGYARWIPQLLEEGYRFHLFFLWVSSPELAIARVEDRVRLGGHDIPEETIRRRYDRGITNFFELYRPLAHAWRVYDNSKRDKPELVAFQEVEDEPVIVLPERWHLIERSARNEEI